MPYRFAYDKDSLSKIKLTQSQGGHNSRKLQDAYDAIKSNPNQAGIRKPGVLNGFLNIEFGSKPEFRLIYNVFKCCPDEEYCKGKPLKNCQGFINIVKFVTREEATRIYHGKNPLSNKINL